MPSPNGNKSAPPAGGLSEEAQAAISVIRALVASRKETSNVLSVMRDYRQLEGESLPYRRFGFSTVEDFLLASREFVIKANGGEATRIYIKPNRDSAHIQEMVAAQKTNRSGGGGSGGGGGKKSNFKALRQPTAPALNGKGFKGPMTTAYSRIYQQIPNSGRNNSTAPSPKKVSFGGAQQLTPSKAGQSRAITKSKPGASPNRGSNSSSPEANNNSRATKNLNGQQQKQQQKQQSQQVQLASNDLRHRLTARGSTLSRSSVEMRQPGKALPTVSSTSVASHRSGGGTTVARKLAFNGENTPTSVANSQATSNAKGSSHAKESTQRNGTPSSGANNRPKGGGAVVAGSGRVVPPAMVIPHTVPPLPLMSITVSMPTTMTKSVNSRLNVAKADLPTSAKPMPTVPVPAPAVPNTYQRAQSLDERTSVSSKPYARGGIANPPANTPALLDGVAPKPLPTLLGKKSLQDRLKLNQEVEDNDSQDTSVAAVVSPNVPAPTPKPFERTQSCPAPNRVPMNGNGGSVAPAPATPPSVDGPFSWDDTNATPVELLMRYSMHKGYSRPEYGYYKLKSGRYQCLVTVNGSTYSTYPDDYVSQFQGQFAAALIAIEAVQRDDSRQLYTVCLDTDREIAEHIYELLSNCPHGMFSKKIPDAFQETHRALLPDHWFGIIDQYANQMFVLEDGPRDSIVFAREQPSGSDIASNTSEARQMSMNQLTLPWDEQYWNLYVTNPVSTVEVWARLVGKEYSDKMDSLITDIEMSMMTNQTKAKKDVVAAVGEYYLVSISDCWFRVRVVEVNYESNQCQCFFIDIGDNEEIGLDQLHRCDPQYLELPAQALCFTLEGLEDFSENPISKHILEQRINHRVLIGSILTKRDEYEKAEQSAGIGSSSLKVVLYDTSTAEDEIVNPILLQKICKSMPVPELNRKSVNYVSITYVDDQGDVYCQLDGSMNYIQKLITNLTQSDALEDTHRGLYNSKAAPQQQLYLVQDETDRKWYRATLDAEESGPYCRMLYVDIGWRRRANVQNIYRLDSLSLGLRSYPPQAIRMRMYELPSCNDPQILARLRAFLKPAVPAMAKVFSMSSATLALVKLYVHVSDREAGNNILVCVNEAIKIEKELEMGSERVSVPQRISFDDDLNSSADLSGSDTTTSLSMSTGGSYSLSSSDGKDLANRFDALHLKLQDSKKPSPVVSPTPGTKAIAKLAKLTVPPVGQLFNVKVTIANNPQFFFVQPHAYLQQLDELMSELQDFCMTKALPVRKDQVRQGEAYAALNNLGHWYRAIVENINPFGPTPIHAHFCDFGQFQQLDVGALRVLPPKFRVLPQQAIKAKLYGVKPLHNVWKISDAMRFKELTVNGMFASVVRSIQPDELNPQEQLIELELIDVSSEDDVYVHKTLVEEGRAVYTAAAHTV
ncbi:uncharacterized protein LOC128727257 [Anopheles nili]|uniref:uncharacterized protein LOC128727257 n=1 Tax=Anopheles nili TaxID=185578 RepID=UPI00237B7E1F|nr:uncharacterized protein LOC128727257 [Anopheles nili]